MSNQDVPSPFGQAHHLVESSDLTPLVLGPNRFACESNFPVIVYNVLNVSMVSMGGAIAKEQTSHAVACRASYVFFERRDFVLHDAHPALEPPFTSFASPVEGTDRSFSVNPDSPLLRVQGSRTPPGFYGHVPAHVVFKHRAGIAVADDSFQLFPGLFVGWSDLGLARSSLFEGGTEVVESKAAPHGGDFLN